MSYSNADEAAIIAQSLKESRVIALVGASQKPERPSYQVMAYLLSAGYRVIPVNPGLAGTLIQGQHCFASLHEIDEPIDMVDVFRQSQACLAIAEEAVAIGARFFWMQIGVINAQAAGIASAAGLGVVQDKCTKIEHGRLINQSIIG